MIDENAIVGAVCKHLQQQGWEITSRCQTNQRGIDIVAEHPRLGRCVVEAKGGTSSKEGTARFGKMYSGSQVFDRVAKAFYTAAALKDDPKYQGASVFLALPDESRFRKLVERIATPLTALDIRIFWVKLDLSVTRAP